MPKGVLILVVLVVFVVIAVGVYFGTKEKVEEKFKDVKDEVVPDFVIHKTGDRAFGDLSLVPNESLEKCHETCKGNKDCIGVSYNKTDKNCYLKGTTGGGSGATGHIRIQYDTSPYQFYYKTVPGYEIKGAGDRVAGDIEGMPVTKETLKDCGAVCDSKSNCVGFSYNSHANICYAKKAEGLAKDYSQTTFQYYDKKTA
jgi:hypothetical protein